MVIPRMKEHNIIFPDNGFPVPAGHPPLPFFHKADDIVLMEIIGEKTWIISSFWGNSFYKTTENCLNIPEKPFWAKKI